MAGLVKKFGAIQNLFIIREKGTTKSKGIYIFCPFTSSVPGTD